MLYNHASQIIDKVRKKKGTIKSLIHSSDYKNIKQLYALVCETLKYSSIIDQIFITTKFLEKEKWLDRSTALVLVYEALFGRGIQCGGKYRLAVKRHKSSLNAALVRMKIKKGVAANKDLLPDAVKNEVTLPRYVRVNTLKMSTQEIIDQFVQEGYVCILSKQKAEMNSKAAGTAEAISSMYRDLVRSLRPGQFMCDVHLENLLVFPPGTDFHGHQLYQTGSIILQDKASCLPAYVLAPPPESHVIDACAAPGNKTSHLAAILENTGRVFAFELDPKRLSVMYRLTKLTGATNLDLRNQDFLKVDPMEERFAKVRYILLDPSCSGSGIVSRLNHLTNDDQSDSKKRLESLARVQTSLLSHALSFPCVERVVYSTCSVHRTENEEVVKETLASHPDFHLEWALPTWKNRGIGDQDDNILGKSSADTAMFDVQACLRAVPKEDLTIGFFVALFQRKDIVTNLDVATPSSKENIDRSPQKKRKKRKRKTKTTQINEKMVNTESTEDLCENNHSLMNTMEGKKKNRKRKTKAKRQEAPVSKKLKPEEKIQLTATEPEDPDKMKQRSEEMRGIKQGTQEPVTDFANRVNRKNGTKRKRKKKLKMEAT